MNSRMTAQPRFRELVCRLFRTSLPPIAGVAELAFEATDANGTEIVVADPRKLPESRQIVDGECYRCGLEARLVGDRIVWTIIAVVWTSCHGEQAITLLPSAACLDQNLMQAFNGLQKLVTSIHLRDFLGDVLAPTDVAAAYVSSPSVLSTETGFPGQLLREAVVSAGAIAAIPALEPRWKEIGVSAALLHPIGKSWLRREASLVAGFENVWRRHANCATPMSAAITKLARERPNTAKGIANLWRSLDKDVRFASDRWHVLVPAFAVAIHAARAIYTGIVVKK